MDNHHIKHAVLTEKIDYKNPYDFSKIHRHSYFEMMLFEKVSGKGVNSIDFKNYPIQEKCLYIIGPNQAHLLERKSNDNGILLQFTKDYLVTNSVVFHAEWLFSLQANPEVILSEQQFTELSTSFLNLDLLINKKSSFNAQKVKHYFFYIIFHILEILNSQSTKKVSTIAIQFLGLVENQFKENRTVTNYAEQMNISVKKLNAEIKSSFGKTPLQFIHDLLAMEIKRLIQVENLSQKEIAYELNFDSPASYTRFVRKQFNCKPTEMKATL